MEVSNSVYQTNSCMMINWNFLGSDLTEKILLHLPIGSIARAACVCKSWRAIIFSSSFASRVRANKPWLFVYAHDNISPEKNQTFAFDPDSIEWIKIRTPNCQSKSSMISSFGLWISKTPETLNYKRVFNTSWRQMRPLMYPYREETEILVSDGPVDITVKIYNPDMDIWEICPPLPDEFDPGNLSQSMCSTLFSGKLYVYRMRSFLVSSFDLEKRSWSKVQTLRPPGLIYSYLISSHDMLVLAGMCNSRHGPSFNLWKIDKITMEFSELAIMPCKLLDYMFASDDGDGDKFANLKCVGLGNLIYVINEQHPQNYPACVCQVNSQSGKCRWIKLPNLPVPEDKFNKLTSFCSYIYLENVLGEKGI